ncbi:VOC family protein [Pyruvatibacter sp.]|uniref:bleomycin resistance protein n=1 Tax=Pyruvatibacter sp. TaxID=1981328 RepID=UPI0032635D1E
MHQNSLVPELSVSDYVTSRAFYRDVLGFRVAYERPEEGFGFLELGAAQLMLDQGDKGRTFAVDGAVLDKPFGRGVNFQIEVEAVSPMLARLAEADVALYLPLEDKWYRAGDIERGNRQFAVADPDGYLLRFFESLGERPAT